MPEEYEPWALEGFSGYLAADEIYDGPFCILFVVDSRLQRRLAYEVLDRKPTQEAMERFFQRFNQSLVSRSLKVFGVTTDGSPLYPQSIRAVWPQARHQVCQFHVLREIIDDVLHAVCKIRKALTSRIPKLPTGRPRLEHKARARKVRRLRDEVEKLFEHRFLLVRRELDASQQQTLQEVAALDGNILLLRELMDEVYRLFDRRCRTDEAQARLAALRAKLPRFQHLGKVLSKLQSPNLDKALTFLDDQQLEATSNSVERANRRHRKMQKSIYRVRTQRSLVSRIALDMLRDRDMHVRVDTLVRLHLVRTPPEAAPIWVPTPFIDMGLLPETTPTRHAASSPGLPPASLACSAFAAPE